MEYPASLAESLVRALGSLSNLIRDNEARIQGKDGKPGYSYSFTDLASLLAEARPKLAAQGLALTQGVTNDGQKVYVTTKILHWAGESYVSDTFSLSGSGTPQVVGSAITYARRYQLMAVLGLASDDDDGHAASAPPQRYEAPPEPAQPPDPPISPEEQEARATYDAIRNLNVDDKAIFTKWIDSVPKPHPKVSVPDMLANAEWRATILDAVGKITLPVASPLGEPDAGDDTEEGDPSEAEPTLDLGESNYEGDAAP